jgi:hypothetical protein
MNNPNSCSSDPFFLGGITSWRVGIVDTEFGIIRIRVGIIQPRVGIIQTGVGIIRTKVGIIQTGVGIIEPEFGIIQTRVGIIATSFYVFGGCNPNPVLIIPTIPIFFLRTRSPFF